ncbi:ABC transporter [Ditylenchus destructor]|nr:ABC transporter [Ditylenchus destructor]
MRKALFCVTPYIFILVDSLVSILCLGFYHPYFHFDANVLKSKLLLLDGYDFTHSPIEFVALCIGRSLFLVMGVFLLLRQINTDHWSLVFLGVQICNLSLSLIKVLAFSEHAEQLTYYGVWMSLVWNVSSFFILHTLWKFGLNNERFNPTQRNVNGVDKYERLFDESQTIESAQSLAATSTPEHSIEPNKEERASTWQHILLLMNFCGHYWACFAIGLALQIICSAGTKDYAFLKFC